jgi:nitric oxide reductase NorD protein
MTIYEQLRRTLIEALGEEVAEQLMADLQRRPEQETAVVLELLGELRERSAKVAQMALEALPELQRRAGPAVLAPWLDLAVAVTGASGAAGLRYVKETPLLLGVIEPPSARSGVLAVALELAENTPNLALDFLRAAPELLPRVPAGDLPAWAEIGLELSRWDYVLGIEFFRQLPAIAAVIPLQDVRGWVELGMKLVTQNSLGKTDYVGTLEYFRASPRLLGGVEGADVRRLIVRLGSALVHHAPESSTTFLAEAPALLSAMPEGWRVRVLQYGLPLAERDAQAALAYLRRCPEIVSALDPARTDRFEDWFRSGMETLEYSAEGARAYFALETNKALASVERALSGVSLRQVARSLNLFAEALCGVELAITSLPESGDTALRPSVSPDGRTLALPAILRRYPTREENSRLYTVMTAHEAGHLEFGTYDVAFGRLADLIAAVQSRYHGAASAAPPISNLEDFFHLYPQPGLIRDLWTVLEDARVEWRLQREYPGLRRDLAALARDAVATRSLTHGLSVRELVVDTLLLLSTSGPDTVRIPEAITDVVAELWALCRTILRATATADETIRLADQVYVAMDRLLGPAADAPAGTQCLPADIGPGPRAAETAGAYRPVTNWTYRGDMNPELVRDRSKKAGHPDEESPAEIARKIPGASSPPVSPGSSSGDRTLTSDDVARQGPAGSALADWLAVGPGRSGSGRIAGERSFLYDEWDGAIKDYRAGWCRVVEREGPEGGPDFAEEILAAHAPMVRLLRRYFESLKPSGLRRLYGQADGEELDLDAVVRLTADRAAGVEPSDRLYARRDKRDRQVAAAFLVDMSGSTSRQLHPERGTVMTVEQEGLIVLCEALEAIGDQYAVYGYSGQGRQHVDFVVLKDFDEAGGRPAQRIGAMSPLQQNRDGAAIRHATRKLLARQARVRLLVLMSDGRPLDDGYADEYSLEDTKMALREARMQGVEPFCITVDREADDYLRRMYGDVRFLVLDRVEALPERLPRLYYQLTK